MFPETLFFIGDEDPLHDDTVEMASKLLNNGVKCEINRYRWLGHGFLSFNTPGGPNNGPANAAAMASSGH